MKINKRIVGVTLFLLSVLYFSGCSNATSTSIQVGESTSVKNLNITLIDTEATAFVDGYEPAPYGRSFSLSPLKSKTSLMKKRIFPVPILSSM